jgi:hypothetical protein
MGKKLHYLIVVLRMTMAMGDDFVVRFLFVAGIAVAAASHVAHRGGP